MRVCTLHRKKGGFEIDVSMMITGGTSLKNGRNEALRRPAKLTDGSLFDRSIWIEKDSPRGMRLEVERFGMRPYGRFEELSTTVLHRSKRRKLGPFYADEYRRWHRHLEGALSSNREYDLLLWMPAYGLLYELSTTVLLNR